MSEPGSDDLRHPPLNPAAVTRGAQLEQLRHVLGSEAEPVSPGSESDWRTGRWVRHGVLPLLVSIPTLRR
jgi:hypothetical protein